MSPNQRGAAALTDLPEPDGDVTAIEHDHRDQAEQAAAEQDRVVTARWLEEADRLEALGSEDNRKLRAVIDRQCHAARVMAARGARTPDFTR